MKETSLLPEAEGRTQPDRAVGGEWGLAFFGVAL